jgi:hypothetical protein
MPLRRLRGGAARRSWLRGSSSDRGGCRCGLAPARRAVQDGLFDVAVGDERREDRERQGRRCRRSRAWSDATGRGLADLADGAKRPAGDRASRGRVRPPERREREDRAVGGEQRQRDGVYGRVVGAEEDQDRRGVRAYRVPGMRSSSGFAQVSVPRRRRRLTPTIPVRIALSLDRSDRSIVGVPNSRWRGVGLRTTTW